MKWPSWLNWNYHIPPQNKREVTKVLITFATFAWLGYHYEKPLAWVACGIMVALDIFIAFLSISTWRSNAKLNEAILDSIKAIKDCYTMLTTAEWNLHRAEVRLAQLGEAFVREEAPADPRHDAKLLRYHLKRALAELEKNGIEFNLLDGEVERGSQAAQEA